MDQIASRLNLGQAFAGMVLLGGITSLPELPAASTASATGDATPAVNNLLGSAVVKVVLLVIAGMVFGRDALTRVAAQPGTLIQGVLGMKPLGAVACLVLWRRRRGLALCPQPRPTAGERLFHRAERDLGHAVHVQPGSVQAALGAYQVRPRFGGPSGFDWGFADTTGAIVPAEVGWEPRFGTRELQRNHKARLALDTSDQPDLTPAARGHGHRLSWRLLADQTLVRIGSSGTGGVMLQGGQTHADPDSAILGDFAFPGLVARGLIRSRPGDVFELLVGHADVSGKLTAAQAVGRDLPSGSRPRRASRPATISWKRTTGSS